MGQKNHEPLGAKHLPGSHTRISFGKGAAKGKVAAWGPKGGRFRGAHRLLLCTWRTSCCEFPPTLPKKPAIVALKSSDVPVFSRYKGEALMFCGEIFFCLGSAITGVFVMH